LAHTGTSLTSITAPVPATGVAAPVTSYGYTGNLLTAITDPDSHVTNLTYSFFDRISVATFADSSTNHFTPAETCGAVDTSAGVGASSSNPAGVYSVTHTRSVYTDALSGQVTTQFDVFGDILWTNIHYPTLPRTRATPTAWPRR
jgi:YD repeat-containing protein